MNLYQLDSKTTDEDFLNYKPVLCEGLLTPAQLEVFEVDKKIVIQLSNRKKYMGRVTRISIEKRSNSTAVSFEVVRS